MKKGIIAAGLFFISGLLAAQAALVTNYWTGTRSAWIYDAASWGGNSPVGAIGIKVGVINDNGANAPIGKLAQFNSTALIVNNSATLSLSGGQLNGGAVDFTFNDNAVFDAAHYTIDLGRSAGRSVITLNDSASITNCGAMQIGHESQGVINQNGGTVTATQIILGVAGGGTANRYNLADGNVTVLSPISFNATDAGSDNGSYFNFASRSTGQLTVKLSNYNFGALIDAGKIRISDIKIPGSDKIWRIDNSVSGQTTLSLVGPYFFCVGFLPVHFTQ